MLGVNLISRSGSRDGLVWISTTVEPSAVYKENKSIHRTRIQSSTAKIPSSLTCPHLFSFNANRRLGCAIVKIVSSSARSSGIIVLSEIPWQES